MTSGAWRYLVLSAALVSILCFAVEKRVVYACKANNATSASSDPCTCPGGAGGGSCHPFGSSISITTFYDIPGECICKIGFTAEWDCGFSRKTELECDVDGDVVVLRSGFNWSWDDTLELDGDACGWVPIVIRIRYVDTNQCLSGGCTEGTVLRSETFSCNNTGCP